LSDAKGSIPEVAALSAGDETLAKTIQGMRQSAYKHFRDAATAWKDRSHACSQFTAIVGARADVACGDDVIDRKRISLGLDIGVPSLIYPSTLRDVLVDESGLAVHRDQPK
jgi:hypothetical protein